MTQSKYPAVKQVDDRQRIRMVKDIFSTVSAKYDFLNHVLSLRRDISWRRLAVRKLKFSKTFRFLDVAAGTADLAIEAAAHFKAVQVLGLDFVDEMIAEGRKKIRGRNLSERIRLIKGDALDLPFPDNSFDGVGMAFGIRNIPDVQRALKEMKRVLTPGGSLFILEMTLPQLPLLNTFYETYLKRLIPLTARFFSPNPDSL